MIYTHSQQQSLALAAYIGLNLNLYYEFSTKT